jgi:hypothetical protein
MDDWSSAYKSYTQSGLGLAPCSRARALHRMSMVALKVEHYAILQAATPEYALRKLQNI